MADPGPVAPFADVPGGPAALYRVERSTEQDLHWATRLAAEVYHGLDVIPGNTMADWFHTNPHGFSTFWHGGERAGNFTLLPLRAGTMQRFVQGSVLERDFGPADLVPPEDAAEIDCLHWESIVIRPGFMGSRARMMKTFALAFPGLVARICPPAQVGTISAIAASQQGAGVLRRMGLTPASDSAARLDGHPLYLGTMASYYAATNRLFRRYGHGNG